MSLQACWGSQRVEQQLHLCFPAQELGVIPCAFLSGAVPLLSAQVPCTEHLCFPLFFLHDVNLESISHGLNPPVSQIKRLLLELLVSGIMSQGQKI